MMESFWHWVCSGLIIGLPLGVLLGVLLGPARVAGVDFRQWFWDPTQPSEIKDDSWIGLVRTAAHIMAGAAAVALLIAAAWQWLLVAPICRFGNFNGLLSVLADCLGFWARWNDLLGIVIGIVVAQFVAEMIWDAGLRWLPALPAPARPLVQGLNPSATPRLVAPPTRRRIVICCDGTWNWPRPERETNVVRLLRAIRPVARFGPEHHNREVEQISYYHLGVGTGNLVDRVVGGGTGVGLSNSVKSCYGFLVDNYSPGDEISLFGFSRGAFVVRSVAGMIGVVGLLQKVEMANFYDVWDWYTDRDGRDPAVLNQLAPNRRQPQDVTIQCIGVWDTVGALGVPGTRFCANQYAFHQTELVAGVRHAFQALAIDEHRANFQAAPWVPHSNTQVFEQVWFPGAHSNVGGGYDNHGLSDTTLLWMVSQILAYGLLDLDISTITRFLDQTAPYPTGTLVDSRTWAWRILGCPVPRPVGTTSTAEKLHESVFAYGRGIYAGARRRNWLANSGMSRFNRTLFEVQNAVSVPGPPRPAPNFALAKSGLCERLLQLLAGSA